MKRLILLMLSLIMTVLIVGCDNNPVSTLSYDVSGYEVNVYDDATMTVLEDAVSSTGVTVELNYYGEDEGSTGAWYSLYVYENDKWNELEYITEENIAWIMIAYIVKQDQPSQMSLNWEELYGELSAGRYLVLKQFNNHESPGEPEEYYLACEFSITE